MKFAAIIIVMAALACQIGSGFPAGKETTASPSEKPKESKGDEETTASQSEKPKESEQGEDKDAASPSEKLSQNHKPISEQGE